MTREDQKTRFLWIAVPCDFFFSIGIVDHLSGDFVLLHLLRLGCCCCCLLIGQTFYWRSRAYGFCSVIIWSPYENISQSGWIFRNDSE